MIVKPTDSHRLRDRQPDRQPDTNAHQKKKMKERKRKERSEGGHVDLGDFQFSAVEVCAVILPWPRKNRDTRAHVAQARDLSSMHAPLFG